MSEDLLTSTSEQPFIYNFDQWNEEYFDHLIQMYVGILQMLDLRIEVVYPIAYIEKAIPEENTHRDIILHKCRDILINGDESLGVEWATILNMCLFHHPRVIAQQLFDLALNTCMNENDEYVFTKSQIDYIVQGILQID